MAQASPPSVDRALDAAPAAAAPQAAPQAPPSPAGPAEAGEPLRLPPEVPLTRVAQTLRFSQRQIQFVFRSRRELGETFLVRFLVIPDGAVITDHPDHARSLFTAKPALVPSLTAESPLRPIVGPYSVLTANEPAHLPRRRLLLPPFHGDAVERYTQMIRDVAERAIERWPVGRPFALAPEMQAITLDVIMSGIFGIGGAPAPGTPEHRLRTTVARVAGASTSPVALLTELSNLGREDPRGMTRVAVRFLDRAVYPMIAARRAAEDLQERDDILSMLLRATDEHGEPMGDQELRDELLTLVLAGFETTANSLAWTWERLMRTPAAYERLRDAVRSEEQSAEQVEAAIVEGMRSRPVIPIVGRRVAVPWRLGDYVVPAGQGVSISILLLHHREDLYPDPYAFRPERWEDRTPGTYEWIPFGGGTRRCLGATLAMAEQRVVLEAMARRLDLQADRPEPEHAQHRNVTMIPARGARAIVRSRRA